MRTRGFTLIEILVAIAIVSILASVAIPSYTDYVRRGRLTEATTNLSDLRVRLEQFYQDNRTYRHTTLAGRVGDCGAIAPTGSAAQFFTYACDADDATGQTYWITATGVAGSSTAGFDYRINERNTRCTEGLYSSWGSAPAAHNCSVGAASPMWVTRKP